MSWCFSDFCVFIVLFQIIWTFVPWIYKNLVVPYFCTPKNLKEYGEWAVITGATDGIGKEYAKQFASNGLNVVLISRSKSKLDGVATEIQKSFNVKTKVIDVDFTNGLDIYDKIADGLKELEVGVLVNNVGMFTEGHFKFHELADKDNYMWDIIALNVITIPFMTKIVLKGMLEKRKGLILNLGSLAATGPFPYCLYSSSKAYVKKFTEDIALEYENSGVEFQSVNPGPVLTNMWTVDGSEITKPKAKTYVESAMRSIGAGTHVIGYLPHAFMDVGIQLGAFIAPTLYNRHVTREFRKSKPKET